MNMVNNEKKLDDINALIVEFLDRYFKNHQILYKDEDKDNGIYLLEKKLEAYRYDIQEKIKYLKKTYKKNYPSDDTFFLDCYRPNENKMYNWKKYVFYVLDKSPSFSNIFLERIKPYSNPGNDFFIKENFYHFYNLHMNIINHNPYEGLDDIVDLLKRWKSYFILDSKLNWIDKTIKELENELTTSQNSTTKAPPRKKGNETKEKPFIDFDNLTLLNLFESTNKYNTFIKSLKTNEIINEEFKMLSQEGCYDKKLLCAIGYLLIEKDYLVKKDKKPEYYKGNRFMAKILVCALNNTFNGKDLPITQANYTGHKKNTFSLYPNDEHLESLFFM